MPYEFILYDKGSMMRFHGPITMQEIDQANGELQGHPDFDTHNFQIFNFLEAELVDIEEGYAEEPAATDYVAALSNPTMIVAMVANSEETIELCNEYHKELKASGSPWKAKLFNSLEDTNAYLKEKNYLK